MDSQLAKNLKAVRMMSGITIWFESEKIAKLEAVFALPRANWPAFIQIDGETFNPSSVEGIYTPQALEFESRIKRGQWQCKTGKWHDRGEKCAHRAVIGHRTAVVDGVGSIDIPVYADEHRSRGM